MTCTKRHNSQLKGPELEFRSMSKSQVLSIFLRNIFRRNEGRSLLLLSFLVMSDSLWLHGLEGQASLSFTISLSLFKLTSIESKIPSNHLICCPLLLLPSIFPRLRVFSNESALHIRCQSLGTLASASVLPMNIQSWFPRNTFQGSERRSLVYIKYHSNSVYKEKFWCTLTTLTYVPAMLFCSRTYLYTVDVIKTLGPLSSLPVFTRRILISVLRVPTSNALKVTKPQNGIAAHESSLWKSHALLPIKSGEWFFKGIYTTVHLLCSKATLLEQLHICFRLSQEKFHFLPTELCLLPLCLGQGMP